MADIPSIRASMTTIGLCLPSFLIVTFSSFMPPIVPTMHHPLIHRAKGKLSVYEMYPVTTEPKVVNMMMYIPVAEAT